MNLEQSEKQFIVDIKQKVRAAQYEALKAVNTHLVGLYWELGKSISEKQALGWGKAIVPTLSKELQIEFPSMSGFSVGNLWLMAQFYSEYQLDENLVPLVREISWSKHVVILKKCKDSLERQFYTLATRKFGWTKDVLIHQVENKTYEKYLLNQTNSLKTATIPIGVATYNTSGKLPPAYKELLPSAKMKSAKINDFFDMNLIKDK